MKTIESYILELDGQQKAIINFLHHHLMETTDLRGSISYGIPMYRRKSWVCYLNPIKKDGIELAFGRGFRLSNEQGILDQKGRKLVAGIDLFDVNKIPIQAINEIVQEALILDDLGLKWNE